VGGVVVVQLRVRFLTCRPVPGIFAIKSKVVKNRAEIWTFFWPSQILGGRISKSYTHVNFLVCRPKFTRFLLSNVGGVVVVQLRVRFLTCRPFPGKFAIKFESCEKSRRNLDLFWPSQILWGRPSKSYTHVMTTAWRHVVWKMFCGDTPTGPEVIGVHTLNFKPNFKFSRFEFFGGTPVPLRVCVIKAWSISSACKIFGAQHPQWAEI